MQQLRDKPIAVHNINLRLWHADACIFVTYMKEEHRKGSANDPSPIACKAKNALSNKAKYTSAVCSTLIRHCYRYERHQDAVNMGTSQGC